MNPVDQSPSPHRPARDLTGLLADEDGLTATEYALLLVLVAVGCILCYRELGLATSDLTVSSTGTLPGAE